MEKTLESAYLDVINNNTTSIDDTDIIEKVKSVCQCESNKAPIRYLLSAMLAKITNEAIDTRQPYPKLGPKSFPGRSIDETIVQPFVHKYSLPCNDTTAFLTPAFRTIETAITKATFEKCRPSYVYYDMMDILDYIESHPKKAVIILRLIIKELLQVKKNSADKLQQMVDSLAKNKTQDLSSEEITNLLTQHLQCRGSSRLPVLMITAAYESVQHLTKETHKTLLSHNAADKQTGALGDIEITLLDDNNTITCYEMKKKQVSTDDIYVIINKLTKLSTTPDNYIIITTESITKDVKDLAYSVYAKTGVELAVLDCIGFINHFLHFFHRYRTAFLNSYQQLVLAEPTSAVSQPLKEAFLSLRKVAEASI